MKNCCISLFRFILFVAFLWPCNAIGQQYGFEWIRPYMPYYKMGIMQKGIYRLDSTRLANAGLNVGSFNPNRLQLFRDGQEQAIFVSGASDGVLNQTDFIEFFAEPNTGKLDEELFLNKAEVAHSFKSQFSDTAVYFLTWLPDSSAQIPLRINDYLANDYASFLPEPNFRVEQIWAPQEEYYYGTFIPADQKYYLSDYGGAEGMMSRLLGLGQSRTQTFATPQAASSQVAILQFQIIGASDFFVSNPNAPNHHVRVYAENDLANSQLILDTTFRGYGPQKFYKTLTGSFLTANLNLRFEVVNDLSVGSDFVGISYVVLNYAKQSVARNNFEELNLNNSIAATKTYVQLASFAGNSPLIWDYKNRQRHAGQKSGSNAQFLLPYVVGSRQFYVADVANILQLGLLQAVQMKPIVPAQYQYLMVSHPKLGNTVLEYAAYRAQQFQTLLTYSPDLYNYYSYGYEHPIAIKRFAKHLYEKQITKPKFLVLVGRGYQNNLLTNNPENYGLNLVPAIGVPSSEHLFSNGFVGNDGAPAMATGRIPAATENELKQYLDKLVFYETRTDSIALWRKSYLHLSGGSDAGEQISFKAQLQGLANKVVKVPIGASVFPYSKTTNGPTESKLKETLIQHQNDGLNMLTFYGHGSLTVLDMDFGGIQDLAPTNKPAFYYFNGCNIGNANDVDPLGTGLVYGKDFICAANKGAIGWLAHSNLTFTNHLEYQMNLLYDQLSGAGYGKPIGENLRNVLKTSSLGNEPFARSHALQLILQGDPALVLYAPVKRDYAIPTAGLFVSPPNATVQNDSLAIGIIVHNMAKAYANDSLSIDVERTKPGNRIVNYPRKWFFGPLLTDTFYFWIPDLSLDEIGTNNFRVKINGSNSLEESNFNNNAADLNYFLPGSGVQPILPYAFEIVSTDTIRLFAQNNNLLASGIEYVFEADTAADFSSTGVYHKSSGVIKADALVNWQFITPKQDSLTWFWRVKLNLPENEGGIWSGRSLTYINAPLQGWHQNKYAQYKQASAARYILFKDSLKQLEFSDNELVIGMENKRWDHRNMGVTTPYLLNEGVFNCTSQGTVVLVFEPFQVDWPYELPNYPFNCAYVQANKNRQSNRYYAFDTRLLSGEQELQALIDSIPQGYMVAMFSRYASNVYNWQSATKNIFAKVGAVKPQTITSNNTAWLVIGKKGEAPGMAAEDTVTNNGFYPNLPPRPEDPQDEMVISVRRNFLLKWFEGDFTTAPVGPAINYSKVQLKVVDGELPARSKWWYDIIGVNKKGVDTLFYDGLTQSDFSISTINAATYPFIKLKFHFVDSTYRTPHLIKFAQIIYTPAPELSLDATDSFYFYKPLLAAGDTLSVRMAMKNLSATNADSFWVSAKVIDENRLVPWQQQWKQAGLGSNSKNYIHLKVPSSGLKGKHSFELSINDKQLLAEGTYTNNFFSKEFVVERDNQNPYLEVTFDGQRIFNGDIVSPNPLIRISATDKNPFLLQQDTSTFELFLQRPSQFDYERIALNSADVRFKPASDAQNLAQLEYTPKGLKDGIYTLKVKAKDASGNLAGANDYEVDFNVIGKSSITQFYPYPNPFTTQMRFVFTLTGSKVPDQLLIRILTMNGKVVREINKEEFGAIRVGNNISEFAWDGTDRYGDKLANGIYLYQVFTRIEGQEIEYRATRSKDEALHFTGNTGKIYLMR
jgi:hypothetical protein